MAVNIELLGPLGSIGSIAHFHRKQAGLSRNQLASLAGVGKTSIYDLEHGKMSMQWNTVLTILGALNISVNYDSPLMEAYGELEESSD